MGEQYGSLKENKREKIEKKKEKNFYFNNNNNNKNMQIYLGFSLELLQSV